jgi:hypothetical protein
MENKERLEVANTIIRQMGGQGKLRAMIGAHSWQMGGDEHDRNFVSFRFKGSRSFNYCKVTLDYSNDLYIMSIGQIRNKREEVAPGIKISIPTYVERYSCDGLFSSQLKPIFERETGLDLSL